MLDVAICGLRRGANFAHILPLFDSCRLSAVCDTDEALLRRFRAEVSDAQRFTHFEELLNTQPDICIVASPVAHHAKQSIAALQAGCHVLQEVFLAETLEQCRQLYEAVVVRGVPRRRPRWPRPTNVGELADAHAEAPALQHAAAARGRTGGAQRPRLV